MKIYEGEQKTEDWHKLRLGKFTGSDFHIYYGKSKKRDDGIYTKTAERITKTRSDSATFSNKHMERGNLLESEAIAIYELEKGVEVKQVSFIELDDKVGCSPDGLVEKDGMIEIKSRDNHIFLKEFITGKKAIPPSVITQMQFNMYVAERKWCDYICYNPNFTKSLYVERIDRDEEAIEKIKNQLRECEEEINIILFKFNKK